MSDEDKCFVNMDGLHPSFDLAFHLEGTNEVFFRFIENQTGVSLALRGVYERGGETKVVGDCADEPLHIAIRLSEALAATTDDHEICDLARNEGRFAVKHLIRTTRELYNRTHPTHPLACQFERDPADGDGDAAGQNLMNEPILSPREILLGTPHRSKPAHASETEGATAQRSARTTALTNDIAPAQRMARLDERLSA